MIIIKRQLSIIVLLCLILTIPTSAEPKEFPKHQSYELADLILSFIPDAGAKEPFISWEIKKREDNIFWNEQVQHSTGEILYPSALIGQAGVLLNGNSIQRVTQKWVNGELVKERKDVGYPVTVSVKAPVYWNPSVVAIDLMMSPIMIQKVISGTPGTFNIEQYIGNQGIQAEKLWEQGYSAHGETGWLLQVEGKKTSWLLCRTSHGASGMVGQTQLILFNSREAAERDSRQMHY